MESDAALVFAGRIRDCGTLAAWIANRFDGTLELDTSLCIRLERRYGTRAAALGSDGCTSVRISCWIRYLSEHGVSPQPILFETTEYIVKGIY
jgi:hypothetical protein